MNILLLISLLFFSISALFSLTRQLQMLQQNSYYPSRYWGWLKTNISLMDAFFYLISSLILFSEKYYMLMIFSIFILIVKISETILEQKKSIKKLVFTGRIKRLYTCGLFILLLIDLIYVLFNDLILGKISSVILLILTFGTPLLTLLIWSLTYPIEKGVSRYYINDAKKILKSRPDIKVIGITGSYGKTSTKFILTRILSEKYNVVCTPQSFNTPMGVVRTIRENLKPQTQIFVCEMGAKNVGDIKEICDIVNPDIALITSVGAQHLETFKSVDNVFKTKFELADAVDKKGGKIFVNLESEEIASRIDCKDYLAYGLNEKAAFSANNLSYGKFGSNFTFKCDNNEIQLDSKLLGLHSIINITGAVAVSLCLGVSSSDIKYAVSSLKPTEHRLEMKTSVNGSILIDDAYNANPEGSLEAVRVLGSFEGMKKVIITPGLIELGEKEYECNFALGLEAAKKCDIIILVGKNRSKPLLEGAKSINFSNDNIFIAESFMDAMNIYSRFADKNTVVLLENDLPDNYLN